MGSVCQHLKCPFPFDLAQFHLSHVHRDTALSVMPPRGKISYSMIRKSPPSKRDDMDSMTPLIWKQARHPREPLSTTAVPRVTRVGPEVSFQQDGSCEDRVLWGSAGYMGSLITQFATSIQFCCPMELAIPSSIGSPSFQCHNSTVTCN